MLERRDSAVELRAEGRTLYGPAMVYGDVDLQRREKFDPGAFKLNDGRTKVLNLRHNQLQAVAWTGGGGLTLTDSREALQVRAEVPSIPAGDAALRDVHAGILNGLSVEFRAFAERRESGLRVVSDAGLQGIGLVRLPGYQQSTVEIRQASGITLKSLIPKDRDLACECSPDGCTFARFGEGLLSEVEVEVFGRQTRNTLAAFGDFKSPLGSVQRGSVRGSMSEGGLDVEIDIPDSLAGQALMQAHEEVGVVVRPFLDAAESVGKTVEREGRRVQEYENMAVRAFIVSATDKRDGWPEPEFVDSGQRAALTLPIPSTRPQPNRRRIWL